MKREIRFRDGEYEYLLRSHDAARRDGAPGERCEPLDRREALAVLSEQIRRGRLHANDLIEMVCAVPASAPNAILRRPMAGALVVDTLSQMSIVSWWSRQWFGGSNPPLVLFRKQLERRPALGATPHKDVPLHSAPPTRLTQEAEPPTVMIRLYDAGGAPMGGVRYKLMASSRVYEGTSDGDGWLEQSLPYLPEQVVVEWDPIDREAFHWPELLGEDDEELGFAFRQTVHLDLESGSVRDRLRRALANLGSHPDDDLSTAAARFLERAGSEPTDDLDETLELALEWNEAPPARTA